MIRLSISRQNIDYPVEKWQEIEINTAKQLINIVKKYPYSIFSFDKGYRSSKNVNKINNILIFDFDNTDKDKIINMKQVLNILKEKNLKGILIETKSSNKEKQGVIAERFRLLIPCDYEIEDIDREVFKRYMENVAKELGIYDYVDKSAFDLSRMFKPSPEGSKVLANNGERLDNLKIYKEAKKQIEQERERRLKELEKKFKNISKSKSNVEIPDKYLTYVDIDAILNISIKDWIERFDNVIEKKEGRYTYLHEKGIHKYSIINDNVAHDFIEDKTYNTLSYLYEKLNVNRIDELGRKLKELGYDFIQVNYQAVKKAVDEALETAKNDREFEDYLKKYFNVKYVKLDKRTLKIANIEIALNELGYEKIDIINRFRENRKKSKQKSKNNEVIKININKDNNKKKRYVDNNHWRS